MNLKFILPSLILLLLAANCAHAQSSITPIGGVSLVVSLAKYDPFPAQAGDFTTVWLDISNRGNQDAQNITFELKVRYPFTLPDNNSIQFIDYLAGSSNKRLEYRLFVAKDAPKGMSEIEINYYIGSTVKYNKKFNITVNNSIENAHLDALFVSAIPTPAVGSTTEISADVVNSDKGTAYYVIAQAESPIAQIERNQIFIGTLEPNDFDNVNFKLNINDNIAPGTYPVNLTFIYRDKDSKLFTDSDMLEIQVLPKTAVISQSPPIPSWMYIIYILVIIIALRLMIPFTKWLIKPFRKRKH